MPTAEQIEYMVASLAWSAAWLVVGAQVTRAYLDRRDFL